MPIVIIVGGPSGTGKTTTATLLSEHYKCPYIEGDDLHGPANVEKMSKGIPLTDEDRWGWLQRVSERSVAAASDANNKSQMCVTSCSMLKKIYRQFLAEKGKEATFYYVFLHASLDKIMERVSARQGHFFKKDMVKSQFDIMEVPQAEELVQNGGGAIVVECDKESPQFLTRSIIDQLKI